jgi:lipid-A-disaccharide synthase
MGKKIFLIAGEASGDSHGTHLVQELRKKDPSLEFIGLGGPKMQAAGVKILEDMTQISVLGFGDVVRKYFIFRKIFYRALAEVQRIEPNAIILIDSPGFNLRFAKKIKRKFPVIYYISPQIWAWGGRRIHTIKKTVDLMLVILPFEEALYRKAGVPCEFVGHPLLDQLSASKDRNVLRNEFKIKPGTRAIGLLSGSRETEVKRILPLMLESAKIMKDLVKESSFFVSQAPNVKTEIYESILAPYSDLPIQKIEGKLYDLLKSLDFALITSGTTTLEATLLGTPFFLLYKAAWSTYVLGKYLIRVSYLGLANLLVDQKIVPEFIQNDIHPQTIAHEAKYLLETPELYEKMKCEFQTIREKLGSPGASIRAAEAVLKLIRK